MGWIREQEKNLFRITDPNAGSKKHAIPEPDPQHCENIFNPSCCELVEAYTVSATASYAACLGWSKYMRFTFTYTFSFCTTYLGRFNPMALNWLVSERRWEKIYCHKGILCSTLESPPPPPPFSKAEDQRRYFLPLGRTPTLGTLLFFTRTFIVFYRRVYFTKHFLFIPGGCPTENTVWIWGYSWTASQVPVLLSLLKTWRHCQHFSRRIKI